MDNQAGTGAAAKRYEMIREIFNLCSGNQMRDVEIREIETSNPEAYVAGFFPGKPRVLAQNVQDGVLIFDVDADGLRQRFSFTPVRGTAGQTLRV
jgi:hypothetical protein